MSEPLAEIPDLIERLGRDLTDTENVRAAALLRDASAAVRAAAWGQTISRETSTGALIYVRDGLALLPQGPVVSVDEVKNDDGDDLSYVWRSGSKVWVATGLLNSWELEPWRVGIPLQPIVVTYTHGYDPVPLDVVAVVCQVAARALGSTPDSSAIAQESLGGYSYMTGAGGVSQQAALASAGFGLLPAEVAVAMRYRRNASPISML